MSKKNTIKNGCDQNGFPLALRKNGKPRKNRATAYRDVAWHLPTDQFVAVIHMDDRMRELSGRGKEATIHLGIYPSILEAAFCASKFHEDLDNNLRSIKGVQLTRYAETFA
tara:strand:- start:738 stop:1070 length:333 start_codon:yes stop_codon:yes gene_type:complete